MVSPRSPPTSITLTWEQPEGADAVGGYEINYSYDVIECVRDGDTRLFQPVIVTLNDGSLRSYTIMNSSTTPVEEDSQYTISITAVNSVGRSGPSNMAFTITADAGLILCLSTNKCIANICFIYMHYRSSTAPGLIQSLRDTSVDVTNITIQWDRVDCQQRNGRTDSYRVVYYPISDSFYISAWAVAGVADADRMFTLTGLPPRTNYMFQVQASNPELDVRGEVANLTVNTSTPQGESGLIIPKVCTVCSYLCFRIPNFTDFGFLLNGRLYPNNSVLTLSDIGNSFFGGPSVTLFCLTPNFECCSASETRNGGTVGEWYLPDGALLSTAGTAFTRGHVASAVSLNREFCCPSPTGVFRCDVLDASGTNQSVYIGIYPESDGEP